MSSARSVFPESSASLMIGARKISRFVPAASSLSRSLKRIVSPDAAFTACTVVILVLYPALRLIPPATIPVAAMRLP